MKYSLSLILFGILTFWNINSSACDKVTFFIEDPEHAAVQCPTLCANSGGWTSRWGCRDVGYCICVCKGPCVYDDPTEKPNAHMSS